MDGAFIRTHLENGDTVCQGGDWRGAGGDRHTGSGEQPLKGQVFCWLLFLIQQCITWESLKRKKMVPETVLGLGRWSPVEDDGALWGPVSLAEVSQVPVPVVAPLNMEGSLGFRGREFNTACLEVSVVWLGPDPFIILMGLLPSFRSI